MVKFKKSVKVVRQYDATVLFDRDTGAFYRIALEDYDNLMSSNSENRVDGRRSLAALLNIFRMGAED